MESFWDETPFGNSYATDFIEELRNNGVSLLEETYVEFSEKCETDIELESKIYAAASIIKYALKGDDEDSVLRTIDGWLERQDDFNAEDFIEDTLAYLERIKMNSALAEYWKEEEVYSSWKSEVQEIINAITRWMSEINDKNEDDEPKYDSQVLYDFDDEDY